MTNDKTAQTLSDQNKLKQEYSKKEVQRAGETLILEEIWDNDPDAFKLSMQVLSNWRANHANSLDQIAELLENTSNKIDRKSIVVKRLKRTPSIVRKLRRFNKMKLRNMQDIAGCRAILSTTKKVQKLRRELNKNREFKVKDYIKKPKEDGYRGIHLVCKCKNSHNGNKYPVEIQLRSKVQHSWATAVEIVDLFTKQALKSNEGQKDWLDFFKYISHEFSKIEGISNPTIKDSLEESQRLMKKLGVYKKFEAYASSLKIIESHVKKEVEGYNLIQIDFNEKTVTVHSFPYDKFEVATEEYLKYEKDAAKSSGFVVALVSSNSIDNLKEAYPNYFADSALFVYNLRQIEESNRTKNISVLPKWLADTGLK